MTNTNDTRTILELTRDLAAARTDLTVARNQLREFVSDVLRDAPECWEEATEAEALAFVRSFTDGGTDMAGHKDDCDCFE